MGRMPLSENTSLILMQKAINLNKNKLEFYGNVACNSDFAKNLLDIYDEFSRNLTDYYADTVNSRLNLKLKDLRNIFSTYEELLGDNAKSSVSCFCENCDKFNCYQGYHIFIDEFTSFTEEEYKIYSKLLKQAKSVTITATCDELVSNPKLTNIFYESNDMINKCLSFYGWNPKLTKLEDNYKHSTELKYLERNLFNYNANEKIDNFNVIFINSSNPKREVEIVASEIYKQEHNFGDYLIITNNLDEYASLVRQVFESLGIPIFCDTKEKTSDNLLTQKVFSLLDIIKSGFQTNEIMKYVKLFYGVNKDTCILENFAISAGILPSQWKGNKEITFIPSEFQDEIDNIKNNIKVWLAPILKFYEIYKSNKQASNICLKLYDLIIELGIEKEITYSDDRTILAYRQIVETLEDIARNFSEISFNDFYSIFNTAISSLELTELPPMQNTVRFCELSRARGEQAKVVFILGMDNTFPSVHQNNTLIADAERENLGIILTTRTKQVLEQGRIYSYLTIPSERLYLSCSTLNTFGEQNSKSNIFNRVKKLYNNIPAITNFVRPTPERTIIEYKNKTTPEIIAKLYNDKSSSISKLESYNACNYKYFMNYGLSAHELIQHEYIPAMDTGNIMHQVMQECVSQEHFDDIDATVASIAKQNLNIDYLGEDYFNALVSNMSSNLEFALSNIKAFYDKTGFKLKDAEWEFDDFDISGTKFRGKIDRIDTYNDSALIVDYKTFKQKQIYPDLIADGVSLQLPIYLDIYCKINNTKPAGITYFNLSPDFDEQNYQMRGKLNSIYDFGDFAKDSRAVKEYSLDTIMDSAINKASETIIEIKSGKTKINPYEKQEFSCKYCSYKDICKKRWQP